MTLQLPEWSSRKIVGLPRVTAAMFAALKFFDQQDDVGHLWLPREGIHGATLSALRRNDFLVRSDGLDGTKYQITTRGLYALQVCGLPLEPRRYDDICPNCSERPVAYSSSGRRVGYCVECHREFSRRKFHRRGGMLKPGRLCPMCGERERHITPSGRVRPYCLECRRERAKDERRRKYERKLERIAAGEFIACIQCDEAHVNYGDTWVSDYCPDCWYKYMNAYNRKRRGKDDA